MNEEIGYLNEKDGIDCTICKNKGYVVYSDGFSLSASACECMKTRQSLLQAKRCQCDLLLETYSFNNFNVEERWQKTVKNQAQEFAKLNDGAFYIGGSVGSGKTHICTAIVREMLNRGKESRYWIWKDLATRLNQLVNSDCAEYDRLIFEVSTTDILYLDDFFKIMPTDAEKDKAFKIINARYMGTVAKQGLITIISSEKTLEQIIAIDEAIGSRLRQMAGKYSLALTGNKNWRLTH